jgi:hypothetical protein
MLHTVATFYSNKSWDELYQLLPQRITLTKADRRTAAQITADQTGETLASETANYQRLHGMYIDMAKSVMDYNHFDGVSRSYKEALVHAKRSPRLIRQDLKQKERFVEQKRLNNFGGGLPTLS